MTKIFYDCEFIEDGKTIELISIGMVSEDGREYYAVNRDMPISKINAHSWLMDNVWLHLPLDNSGFLDVEHEDVKPAQRIADEVRDFIQATHDVELWAWYGAYDHVALCQLWGRMIDLPAGVPMWTNDLQQEVARLDYPKLPKQAKDEHNALADARYNRLLNDFLIAERQRQQSGEASR
ncbi:3'-5' exoribonuclease domain-containing protein [Nonomuraea sp. NPDC059194]|uniref:3'-5' exoribonuclease domain-containing protein n=1 Tax=Nonomuraea sp. NPDC059194 TaxID=3346764 RepID=UPI0036CC7DF8